jgi:signal transduction histidine kinase/ligand-binding sensor domain-containing protein/DNA-binding response OmpR family regulator
LKNNVNNERLLSAYECKNVIRPILFVIFFLVSFHHIYPQNSNITFEHFSIDQGLYETNITSVIQDNIGFLWFGTWSGIEKYDGYNFTTYKNNPDNSNRFDNLFVNTLYEDSEGNIWMGTWHGLEKFDKSSGVFTHYKPDSSENEIGGNDVHSICEDEKGIFWIGTANGLNVFDSKTGQFKRIRNDNTNPASISSNNVNVIYEDRAGELWFGTGRGLDKIDKKTGKFIHLWYNPSTKNDWTNYWVNTIFEDKSGILWLGTREGILAFDQKQQTFTPYIKAKDNSISSICEDQAGTLWIGSWVYGLYSLDKRTKKINHYLHDNNDRSTLSNNTVTSVYCERSATIWITTLDGGVNKINRIKLPFKKYLFDRIYSIVRGNDDMLWIGTSKSWYKFNPKTEQIIPYSFGTDYLIAEEKSGDLWIGKESGAIYKRDVNGRITNFYDSSGQKFNQYVTCLYKTPDGIIWIGTDDGGAYKINPQNNVIKKILQVVNRVKDFHLDKSGLLWIGSIEGGLICYDPQKNIVVKHYLPDAENPESIKSNVIFKILEDKTGSLYFGTNNGLGRYEPSVKRFDFFNDKSGLPHNLVWQILDDNHGNYWLSTWKGISKFDTKTDKFQNYDASYGLPENGLSNAGSCKTDNGEMYFGCPSAVVRFHPDSIKNNPFIPPIVITSIQKFEKSVPISKKIDLSYDENFLSFEFITLSYISPERNQYAYKMEGVDTGWIYSGTRRYASYPNLDPGEYIFKVKGSNNDGVWNEAGTYITIIITPPFWKTWWAYLSYAGIFIFTLYGVRRYDMNRIALKNKIKIDGAILKEREEMDGIKSKFFTNISHEFRTPLTLILGPAEKIEKSESSNPVKDAGIITRNSKRLLQLVNQLLDLSKLDAGKLKLETFPANIVSFVKGIALSFESLSEAKDVVTKIKSDKEFIEVYFDKEKMFKVFSNLLSNACKFTPERGNVIVSITETLNNTVEIRIKNTGIGIPQKELPKLFDRFYQVDSSQTKEYEGTGIGLALVKELIELHNGSISVDSKESNPEEKEKGWTEFTINLPLGRVHLKDDEILSEDKQTYQKGTPVEEAEYLNPRTMIESEPIQDETKTTILVVEDNYDMREYIKESLSDTYAVEEAVNGEQGVRIAENIIPDLIISDLMMPKMDGNELTRILKNDERTSHIPIIILTAKSGQENKIEGLQTGADDYLTKPFDLQELRVRVENLISIRKKLQEKFSKGEFLLKRGDKKLRSIDEKFLAKVLEVIEKHLSEEEFSIEECSNEVGLSRTHFHKKLRALVGKSPSQYVRTVRLYRAKQMIEEEKGNVSEIAYSVGFSSPAYFSRCFKEEFGYSPSETLT